LDVSRTVGWFTAAYPLTLELSDPDDDAAVIKDVKERMRCVPAGGVGYGVLRYLQEQSSLSDQPAPPVLFNYVGRETASMKGTFRPVSAEKESSRAPDNNRLHLLEVVAMVRGGRLTTQWHYSDTVHKQTTIERLANNYADTLSRLVQHCVSDGAGGFTPSDFPEAGLDQDELDHFLGEIV
jgi:non-ribosomal peptide synthase protein (TIGR01720 family)